MKPLEVLGAQIQEIANKKSVAIIGFVAPQQAIRISPISFASAAIDESAMYQLEDVVRKIKSVPNPPTTLHLIVQTPGGELFTSYKIAYYLRKSFTNIQAYVPYQAASGGTILCCSANQIYLGELGNLTAIDPQVRYKDTRVSAYAFERSVDTLYNLFGKKMPAEVPTPYQQMAEKVDPVVFDEMQTVVFNTYRYAYELLSKSGYEQEKAKAVALKLSRPDVSHGHPILIDEAKEIGLNVLDQDDNLAIYGNYVSQRLTEQSANHIIEHFIPVIKEKNVTTNLITTKPYNTESTPAAGPKTS